MFHSQAVSRPPLQLIMKTNIYFKFGNFRENFIVAKSVKRHICNLKNLLLGPDLPTSVNDRVISWGFYFHETSQMWSFKKIKPSRKFLNLQYPVYKNNIICLLGNNMGLNARKPIFGGFRTAKAQTSLHIHADWSAPFLFSYWKVQYLDLVQAKFQ